MSIAHVLTIAANETVNHLGAGVIALTDSEIIDLQEWEATPTVQMTLLPQEYWIECYGNAA